MVVKLQLAQLPRIRAEKAEFSPQFLTEVNWTTVQQEANNTTQGFF